MAGIAQGRNHRDVSSAPGERSLAALVESATFDPEGSILELRAEALRAAQASAAADIDVFSARQLRARSVRYARAVALVEACCLACGACCMTGPLASGPGIQERRITPERRMAEWRAGSRRLDDRYANRVYGMA